MNEYFVIIGRTFSENCSNLRSLLSKWGKVDVITDQPSSEGIWYPAESLEGFGGLTSNHAGFPAINGWSRALYHLETVSEPYDGVWIVEDDVAGDQESLEHVIRTTARSNPDLACLEIHSKAEDPTWPHWGDGGAKFANPWRSFKPFSRKSARLIESALDFRARNNHFVFHEILFPSLAKSLGGECIDWHKESDLCHLFMNFRYRPEICAVKPGISHPVKNRELHNLTIAQSGARRELFGNADVSTSNLTSFTDNWYELEPYRWTRWINGDKADILEVNHGSGKSAEMLVSYLFPHRETTYTGFIDRESKIAPATDQSLKWKENDNFRLLIGDRRENLNLLRSQQDHQPVFDVIHFNHAFSCLDSIHLFCECWEALRPRGLLVIPDYDHSFTGRLVNMLSMNSVVLSNKPFVLLKR